MFNEQQGGSLGNALARFSPTVLSVLLNLPAGIALPAGASFSRASTARYTDVAGLVQSAAINAIRNPHYINGAGLLLLEGASANVMLQSENLGATGWTNSGTTRTAGALACGTVSMDKLADTLGSGSAEQQFQTFTFTGDGVKGLSYIFAQGSSTSSGMQLFDITSSAYRLRSFITWNAGVPTVTVNVGTLVRVESLGTVSGHAIYRALVLSNSTILAAHTNRIQVQPANDVGDTGALTGDFYIGGIQAEDGPPTSYIPTTTTTASRSADVLSIPGVSSGGTATLFQRYLDLATSTYVDAVSAYTSLSTITPSVGRAYQVIAVLNGTLTAAQCAAVLGVA